MIVKRYCDRCGSQIRNQIQSVNYYNISALRGPVISVDPQVNVDICPKCYEKLKKFLKIGERKNAKN